MKIGLKHPKTYCDWSNFTSKSIPSASKSIPTTSKSIPGSSKSIPMTSGSIPITSRFNPTTSKHQQTSSMTDGNPSTRHRTTSKGKFWNFSFCHSESSEAK